MKLAIYYEQDDEGIDTGRVQVVDEDEDEGLVLDTFDNEPEAEAVMAKMQAEDTRNKKITKEYLEWEESCLSRHDISKDDLRVYLVNMVIT